MPTAAQQAAAAAAATPATPGGASVGGGIAATPATGGSMVSTATTAASPAHLVYSPMEVFGEIDGDGLGLTEWWLPAQEEEEAVEAEVDMAEAADEVAA